MATTFDELDLETCETKKADQADHECEILENGSEGLQRSISWTKCEKNPQHFTFIPAPKFDMCHIPKDIREKPVLALIKNYMDRTVRLTVRYVSMGRPNSFPFFRFRGKREFPHRGSGWIDSIAKGIGPCPLSGQMQWWSVDVFTARHVVFDTEEARASEVDIFFDDDESSLPDGKMKTLKGVYVLSCALQSDHCKFRCVCHDENLFHQLNEVLAQQNYKAWPLRGPPGRVMGKPCVVISHPHAAPKMVTIGEVKGVEPLGKHHRSFVFSADTCPGSSGGPVVVLQDDAGPGVAYFIWAHWVSPHSGQKDKKLNQSSSPIQLMT